MEVKRRANTKRKMNEMVKGKSKKNKGGEIDNRNGKR